MTPGSCGRGCFRRLLQGVDAAWVEEGGRSRRWWAVRVRIRTPARLSAAARRCRQTALPPAVRRPEDPTTGRAHPPLPCRSGPRPSRARRVIRADDLRTPTVRPASQGSLTDGGGAECRGLRRVGRPPGGTGSPRASVLVRRSRDRAGKGSSRLDPIAARQTSVTCGSCNSGADQRLGHSGAIAAVLPGMFAVITAPERQLERSRPVQRLHRRRLHMSP